MEFSVTLVANADTIFYFEGVLSEKSLPNEPLTTVFGG